MDKRTNYVLQAFQEGRTIVYGHRGSRAYAPMNTIPAFELAIQQGADGIELDVQLSADRELVIIHDFTVDGTTDGTGAVRDLLFAELRELNAAARFSPMAEPLQGHIPHYPFIMIPTLEEVFSLVKDRAPADFIVNVEIKAPYCTASGGFASGGFASGDAASGDAADDNGIEALVAACIDRYDMARNVIVSSFNPPTLKRFKAIKPSIPVGFLVEEASPSYTTTLINQYLPDIAGKSGHEAWHPRYSMVNPELVATERNHGRLTQAWTVNEPQLARDLVSWGVTGIITDMPDRIKTALSGN
ncbi:glycerophosphodiester phosphodiesterase family protein [Gracilinema caldarium]|uniref:glycerophosphodiester phosphodiesterase n=1 Tax=Gracilinema caldarium TaxID=215591 RepID=UPI0026F0D975|nr:glycerophosphodiester phosphodiesterase family protein [Gracilinema caldarium]